MNLVTSNEEQKPKPQFVLYNGGEILECQVASGNWNKFTVIVTEPDGVVVGLEDGAVNPRRFPNHQVRRCFQVLKKKTQPSLLYQQLPEKCFEITVDSTHGLGVRLGWTKLSEIVVQSFLTVAGVGAGPLEASELVNLGDQLLAVNDKDLVAKSFAEVSELIRQSPRWIKLRFGRWKWKNHQRNQGG
jgi:hypothetical protein